MPFIFPVKFRNTYVPVEIIYTAVCRVNMF